MATAKITKRKAVGSAKKESSSMKLPVYTQNGEKKGDITLPKEIFGVGWNGDLVHQVVTAMQANARTPIADVKDRSEVRGGGRKPWKQKGTGRARHGSRRSPIWVGGGVTHGPSKNRSFKQKINKKMRTKALFVALSRKARDNEIMFVDQLRFEKPSARDARATLGTLGGVKGYEELNTKKKNAALIVVPENTLELKRSFSNFGNVGIEEVRNLNPVDILTYKFVLFVDPKTDIKTLEERGK